MKKNLLKLAEELEQKWEDDGVDEADKPRDMFFSEIMENKSKPYHGYIADNYVDNDKCEVILSDHPHYKAGDKDILTKVGFLSIINSLMQDLKKIFPNAKIHARPASDSWHPSYQNNDPQRNKELAQYYVDSKELKREPLYVEVVAKL